MNGHMAYRASLVFLRLVVKGRRGGRARVYIEGVALQTHEVDLAALEQSRVRRAMRCVARRAPFNLYRRVLIYKRAGFFGVTLKTNGVLRSRGTQLSAQKSTMWIVTVAALNDPLVHAVMEDTVELLLGLQVARVAELRLSFLH